MLLNGATYSPEHRGAKCPAGCDVWVPARNVYPWERGVCVRRHRCPQCGGTFKSIQEDPTYEKVRAA